MRIQINELNKEKLEIAESLLFNGNGYLGLRNNLTEEYYDFYDSSRETFINGFYETTKINYPEICYGFTPTEETMLSVIDSQTVHIFIDGIKVNMTNFDYSDHERYLDMKRGISLRSFVITDKANHKTKITLKRLTPFEDKEIYYDIYNFEKINHELEITLENDLNLVPQKSIDYSDSRVSHGVFKLDVEELDFSKRLISLTTKNSKLKLNYKYLYNLPEKLVYQSEEQIKFSFIVETEFIKVNGYFQKEVKELSLAYDEKIREQERFLKRFWDDTKVEIESDDDLEASINYGLYSLLQSTGQDGLTSIAAKGLSGSGYQGHYFWDAEMYVLPVFIHTNPDIAKKMLEYRIKKLPEAIANREMIGYKTGALYAWRTISGKECSPFFEAGMAQHHISADIIYGLIKYVEMTGDGEILRSGGFKMMEETSKFYKSLIYLKDGQYHFDKVTGPDEYSTLVNDNYYTNSMIKNQFEKLIEFSQKYNFKVEDEISYREIAKNIYLGFDKEKNIIKQDRDFLNKQLWPYNDTKYPLLLNYHPLEIYRYQVSKQADAVLALMLNPDLVSEDVLRDSVHYYDKVTTHDSSLSFSVYSIVYARLKESDKAYEYFLKNARLDLDNAHHNTKDGIHTAAMGGTFMTLLYGFLDFKVIDGVPQVKNNLPKEIKSLKLPITYQNKKYIISAMAGSINITSR